MRYPNARPRNLGGHHASLHWCHGQRRSRFAPRARDIASYATEGEAQVAQAKLSAYEIESAIVDQIEGGAVPIEGEAGITLAVAAQDAPDARQILDDIGTVDDVGTVDDPDGDAGA